MVHPMHIRGDQEATQPLVDGQWNPQVGMTEHGGGVEQDFKQQHGKRRNAQTSSSATSARSSPLETRCVNSMMVAALGECCVTVPLHSGQCLPHPAPEPVARTNAPHNTTARL